MYLDPAKQLFLCCHHTFHGIEFYLTETVTVKLWDGTLEVNISFSVTIPPWVTAKGLLDYK